MADHWRTPVRWLVAMHDAQALATGPSRQKTLQSVLRLGRQIRHGESQISKRPRKCLRSGTRSGGRSAEDREDQS